MRHLLPALALVAAIAIHVPSAGAQRAQQERALPRAAELVDRYRDVVVFCAPCGDVVPGVPFRAKGKSGVLARGGGDLMVLVNGRELALQSTYVRTEPGWYRNLAVLLDVPAPGAAPSLRVDNAGTTGELIAAVPGPRVAEPGPPVSETTAAALAAPSPPEASPPSVVVVRQSGDVVGLALLALLVSGIAGTCMLWILLVLRIRRRRAMVPRAVHLRR